MFDSRQTDIIRQALIECDSCETLALTGVAINTGEYTREDLPTAEEIAIIIDAIDNMIYSKD